MVYSKQVLTFWEKVKKETGITGDYADAWSFGDNSELADELLHAIKRGIKRTTTSLVIENQLEDWPDPKIGDYDIILEGKGVPALVIETVSVRKVKYRDVDAEHAYWEGEGDRDLETYFKEHDKYYRRRGKELGFEFNKDMMVYLSKFKVVYAEE